MKVLLIILVVGLVSYSFAEAKMDVKYFYQPTQRKNLYSQDPAYEQNYQFGIKYTFLPYQDPQFEEALLNNNPLFNQAYDSYNLIIIVNKVDRDDDWGRAQTMRVYQRNLKNNNNDGLIYYWYISTGLKDFATNSGYFLPKAFSSRHWSTQYDAPMRSSVFFDGGKALHASIDTQSLEALGKVYSHGCVHIEDNRAEELFHRIGHSGYGEVDLINQRSGKPMINENGEVMKTFGTKTLIVIH